MNKVLKFSAWSILVGIAVMVMLSLVLPLQAQFNASSGSPGSSPAPGSVADFTRGTFIGDRGYVRSNAAASVTLGTNLVIPLVKGRGVNIAPLYGTTVSTGSFSLLIDGTYDGVTWTTDHPFRLQWTPTGASTNGVRTMTNLNTTTFPNMENVRALRITKWTNATGVSLWVTNIQWGYFK